MYIMNDVIKTIERRRSTRTFKNECISDEHKQIILEAAINAPTAGNMTLYSIIDVTDQELKDKLSVLCDNQPFMKTAKLVLLFVTNSNRWYDAYNKLNGADYKPTLSDYYLGLNDAIIACQNAVIAAESVNIGSCYIGDIVENYEEIKKIFNLPKYVNPACLAVFGYKVDDENKQRPKRFKLEDVVCENTFIDKNIDAFVNKFDGNEELASKLVNGTFNFKMKSEFFKEMNRSLKLMVNEYIEE